jgi:hypothetical protein
VDEPARPIGREDAPRTERMTAHVGSSARCSPCSVLCQWYGRSRSSTSAT